MRYFRLAFAAGILSMALFTAGTPAFAQAGNEWTTYGGDYANTRYSTLDQINTRNVNKLKVAWIHSLGALETQERRRRIQQLVVFSIVQRLIERSFR